MNSDSDGFKIHFDSLGLQLGLALLAGVAMPFAFSPYDQAWLAPLLLALLFHLWWHTASPRQAFLVGYLFGLGQFLSGVWWIYLSMHFYGGASPLAAAGLTLLFNAAWAFFPAFSGLIFRWLVATEAAPWQQVFAPPTLWMSLEWLRDWVLNGFPWLQIGYSQSDTPLAGFVPLFGVYGAGWLVVLTAAVFGLLWRARYEAGRWVGLVVLVWLVGAGLRQISWTEPAGHPLKVALLQGNIDQEMKWRPETRLEILATYLQMTRQHWGVDLIIWPETAIPAFYNEVREDFLLPLQEEAIQHGSDLLIGIPEKRPDASYYNALISLGKTPGIYYKRHLLPFGEYLPWRGVLGFVLDLLQIPLGDFNRGGDEQPPLVAAGYPLAATICYEDTFARDALLTLPEAAYIVNVTNDAWFGDTAAPHQHLQMARMRALESGRFLLRATNTGVTAVIGPDGTVRSSAALFVRTALTESFTPMRGTTPYVRWRDWPLGAGLLGVMLLLLWQGVARGTRDHR